MQDSLPMTLSGLALALAIAPAVAFSTLAESQAPQAPMRPIFDAHLHYNE